MTSGPERLTGDRESVKHDGVGVMSHGESVTRCKDSLLRGKASFLRDGVSVTCGKASVLRGEGNGPSGAVSQAMTRR